MNKQTQPQLVRCLAVCVVLILSITCSANLSAQTAQPAPATQNPKPKVTKDSKDSKDMKDLKPQLKVVDEKANPLPLHQVEGSGGILTTLSAYIVNPPRNGEPVGRPSVGFGFLEMGHDMDVEAVTITESPFKRVELGYGWDRMSLGNLPQVLSISTHEVQLHNANLRVQLLEEGEFNQKWLPALTMGVHYKYNDGITSVDKEVGGALSSIAGIKKDNGTDFTLYASKLVTQLRRPVLFEAGGRATEAVWDGFGGFTDHYNVVFEGNVAVFVTDKLILAGEYKQQPKDYTAIGNVFQLESDWWTVDAAYVVNKNLTLAAAYGHFGNVLNHQCNGVWGFTAKYEF